MLKVQYCAPLVDMTLLRCIFTVITDPIPIEAHRCHGGQIIVRHTPPIERINNAMEVEGSGQDRGEPPGSKMPRTSLNHRVCCAALVDLLMSMSTSKTLQMDDHQLPDPVWFKDIEKVDDGSSGGEDN